MPLLDAVLAYALSMLLFATIVSATVGFIYHLLGLKEKGLKQFIQAFFDQELSQALHTEVHSVAAKGEKEISDTLQQEVNTLIKAASSATHSTNPLQYNLLSKADSQKLVSYTTEEFIAELKASSFGKAAVKDLKEHSDELFDRIAKRYESFGTRFNRIFKKNLHITSTLLGIILAYALNADSIHLISTYMSNNQISAQVVNSSQSHHGTVNAYTQEKNLQAGSSTTIDEMNSLSAAIDDLRADAFPLGWSLFPHCPPHSADYRCDIQATSSIYSKSYLLHGNTATGVAEAEIKSISSHFNLYITWFIGCLLTGLLSGLGAPFWYDVIKGIQQFKKSV